MKILRLFFFVMMLSAMAVPVFAASSWQNDNLNLGANILTPGNWQIGARANLASRGVDEIGGFVSPDASASESAYIWHRSSGIYFQVQNANSINGERDFGDSQSYSVGLYREMFLNDLFVDVGYRHYNLWGAEQGLDTDFSSFYGGVYLPRVFANNWCDGLRFYAEGQEYHPDDRSIMKMGGGFVARVGVKTKLFLSSGGGSQLLQNGLDVDISTGGNDGVFGRDPDVIGFEAIKLSTQYFNVGDLGVDIEPYLVGVNQSRPGQEEDNFTTIGGIKVGVDF